MVAEGEGRKDGATHRLSGRAPDNRLVHFTKPEARRCAPATWSTVEITYAAPHHLLAEGAGLAVRRTRAGDAWEQRNAAEAAKPAGVMLGSAEDRRSGPATGLRSGGLWLRPVVNVRPVVNGWVRQ